MTEKIDLLLEPRWIAPVEPDTLLTGYAIAVRGSQIVDLLPADAACLRYQASEHLRLPDHLVIPGLINLHTHAAMSLMRGMADDLPLMDWLQNHIWPSEAAHVSSAFVHDGTLLACAEMLRGGITCFNDMYFYPQAAAEASTALGMRATLGITVLDFPNAYANDTEDYLNKGLAVRDQWLNHPLISFCLAPHAPYSVSDAGFERVITLSELLGLPIHCHIHETRFEIEESLRNYDCRPLQRLKKLGLLSPNLIAVHAVHLNHGEIEELARHGCSVAHCPTSNLKLASGIAPITAMTQRGINVGLGTDGAASNNRLDILQEMRQAALLAKVQSGDAASLSARQVLGMATLNAARALGLDQQIGSIRPGKEADLCAIDLSALELQPCYDPVSQLVYAAGREQVTHVWIAGRCCVRNKKLAGLQENDLKNTVSLWQNRLEIRPGCS